MKSFTNAMPRSVAEAVRTAQRARAASKQAAFAGGGSDLLGMVKDHVVSPDVVVYLRAIPGLDTVTADAGFATVGGLITLDALARHELVRKEFRVLSEAADSVATPQIRNAATLAGNICQRPWCWYYRNGFSCFKNGGSRCYSVDGENQFHAIFGGGPSYIVHPSDTAPALVALDARFRLSGPAGQRIVPAAEFFVLPKENASVENVLRPDEVLEAILLPRAAPGRRSSYHKVMDREAWTHAIVSAAAVVTLDERSGTCRDARVTLGGVAPIPWRVPSAEQLLIGRTITAGAAARAAEAAVEGARPLAKNGYKVAMTQALVRRTIESLADSV